VAPVKYVAGPILALVFVGALSACGHLGPDWVAASIDQEFVRIPAGTFLMGSERDEPGREAQERQHEVTLSRSFYLARTEVTQAQWQRVMGTNPSRFADCPDCPVEEISAHEIELFLTRASDLEGVNFRLPTEAEWEYACRAGTDTVFGIGDELDTDHANYDGHYPLVDQPAGEFRERTTPVGSFSANPWGLFDMNGNVWEWTADLHCEYPAGQITDPRGSCATAFRVIRGGSWIFGADSARCALRYTHRPEHVGPSLGFRLAR